MEERKSMGSALVDVFDAGVVLVKSEINGVTKKVGDVAKAKGLGVVLLLAAVAPLVMGLIFLILALFYFLMTYFHWNSFWAAFAIALLSFVITAVVAFLGIQKLGAEVKTDMPRNPVPLGPPAASVPVTPTPAVPVGAAIAAGQAANTPPKTGQVQDVRFTSDDLLGDVLGDSSANRTVYESQPDGEAQYYGSGLNKKMDDHHDPKLQNPVALKDGPGISVSTRPTYPDDMKREGY